MPLSAGGKKALSAMIKEYGTEKGKKIFYSKENKGGAFARAVKKHAKKKKK